MSLVATIVVASFGLILDESASFAMTSERKLSSDAALCSWTRRTRRSIALYELPSNFRSRGVVFLIVGGNR
jgi:hypothetical protein